jgi:hypothetical protein
MGHWALTTVILTEIFVNYGLKEPHILTMKNIYFLIPFCTQCFEVVSEEPELYSHVAPAPVKRACRTKKYDNYKSLKGNFSNCPFQF